MSVLLFKQMNIFRLVGDLSHLLAFIILLQKIWITRSCAGISGKMQVLLALVFSTRYIDVLIIFISAYHTFMKIFFLTATYGTLYLIYIKFKATYDRDHDTFRIEFLIIPAAVLAFFVNYVPSVYYQPPNINFPAVLEILWTFSIYLEAVAVVPQLFFVNKTGEAETSMFYYLFALSTYRVLYLLNWIYRYYNENHFDPISTVSGIVQVVFYCSFFLRGFKNEETTVTKETAGTKETAIFIVRGGDQEQELQKF